MRGRGHCVRCKAEQPLCWKQRVVGNQAHAGRVSRSKTRSWWPPAATKPRIHPDQKKGSTMRTLHIVPIAFALALPALSARAATAPTSTGTGTSTSTTTSNKPADNAQVTADKAAVSTDRKTVAAD